YRRTINEKGGDQILIANADGTSEQVIFRRNMGLGSLIGDPSWSTAGDLIATAVFDAGKGKITSILVMTTEGKLVKEFPLPMLVTAIAWLPDSSGLFFVVGEKSTGLRWQIWFQPYHSGGPFKGRNDLSG